MQSVESRVDAEHRVQSVGSRVVRRAQSRERVSAERGEQGRSAEHRVQSVESRVVRRAQSRERVRSE